MAWGPVTAIGGRGVVLETIATPDHVLGRFTRHGLSEYVLAPPVWESVTRHDPTTIPALTDFWQRQRREAVRRQAEGVRATFPADHEYPEPATGIDERDDCSPIPE